MISYINDKLHQSNISPQLKSVEPRFRRFRAYLNHKPFRLYCSLHLDRLFCHVEVLGDEQQGR